MLVRHLHLKVLAQHHFTLVSHSMCSLAPLLYVDETDLNVLNVSNKPIFEVVADVQNVLNIYHFPLKASGSDLKLEKCF